MLPGYLHFDVRRGLRADMLNASMAALLSDHHCVREAFAAVGLDEVSLVVGSHSVHGMMGSTVHFYLGQELIKPEIARKSTINVSAQAQLPKWDLRGLDAIKYHEGLSANTNMLAHKSSFVRDCLSNEAVPLNTIRQLFLSQKLKPAVSAIALKIVDKLSCPIFNEQALSGFDALWLSCHLLMLCAQVDALDPKFISATRLCIGERKAPHQRKKHLSISDDTWINALLTMVPAIEIDEHIPADVLAIAFIKTLAGHFGARGDSTILRLGTGLGSLATNGINHIEALWCEASLPESMNECGTKNSARLQLRHEISGLVQASSELPHLCSTLSLHGAKALSWQLVHGEKNQTFYQVKFNCSDDDKREVIEAFLIKGGAHNISVHLIEHHELNRRLVSVPMGTGNKTSSIRFYEYIYYDKTVRVEPLKEDLDHYVQKTDYSIDVAKSDLLMAWKKWRGRVAMEAP